ncbi:SDR family NAD(P)-dependent oxidoreductase [Castellaniella defragrans]|uniref:3-oxoacyl-[acyl-carrier protein] reductase n=1 Tax=Castellaniella defragrans TaxID=75697 RepID=A0A7W9WP81_CASDE|nr:SDR family oxidoreductase [Castellaniella defragrans]MBB6084199.1 3-oxoacyl-[acyl-carrier protein] reductase [Castellaniella defragrans]
MAGSLLGKVAVVTGGAGGIGAAICEALAAAGASVVVGYHHGRARADALAAALPRAVPAHSARRAPVTDSAALEDLARQVRQHYGRCDVLVNCAGTTRFVPHAHLDELDDALIDEILATNVRGPYAAIRAFRSLLMAHGYGLVVNISSIAAVSAMGSNVMYCASKAALDNMTRSLARALAPHVRVVSVSPGLAETDFVRQMDPGWHAEQAGRTPLGRLAEPREVGAAVVAAATSLAFTTGAVIPVDGGRQLG